MRSIFLFLVLFSGSPFQVSAGRFALSFDDAPRASSYLKGHERAAKLIRGLKNSGVDEAVFYSIAWRLKAGELSPRLMKYAEAKHLIANHTASHPNLEDVTAEAYIADIETADRVLCRHPNYRRWFRFPCLREAVDDKLKHDRVKQYLAQAGYRQGYVTVEIYDWHIDANFQREIARYTAEDIERFKAFYLGVLMDSLQFYENLAQKYLGRSPVHVILLHENDINALFLPSFIELAKSRGFEPVRASDAFQDPLADRKWDACKNSMRRLRTVAEASGASREASTPEFVRVSHLDGMMRKLKLLR